jgi:ribonuclease P protein subunit RPR2
MVRIAAERISDLFALAESEAKGSRPYLSDRYVRLARKIGMRYNVRLLPEYSELFCRGCSRFWVEGRTVQTRLRAGRRVRTCLGCRRRRRTAFGPRGAGRQARASPGRRGGRQPEVALLTGPLPARGGGAITDPPEAR